MMIMEFRRPQPGFSSLAGFNYLVLIVVLLLAGGNSPVSAQGGLIHDVPPYNGPRVPYSWDIGPLKEYLAQTPDHVYSWALDLSEGYWDGNTINPEDQAVEEVVPAEMGDDTPLLCYMGRNRLTVEKMKSHGDLSFRGNRLNNWDNERTLVQLTDTDMASIGLDVIKFQSGNSTDKVTRDHYQNDHRHGIWCFEYSGKKDELSSVLKNLGWLSRNKGIVQITSPEHTLVHSGTGRVIALSKNNTQHAAKLVRKLEPSFIKEVFLLDEN